MGEQRLGALAVGLPAKDPAAKGRTHRDRGDEFPGRTVAQARRFGNQLVQPRIDVVGKLDFRHRAQAIGPHPHCRADDPAFVDRGIEHAALAELLLQAGGGAEHPAEIADILAEHDHVAVALHHDMQRLVDRLDHVEPLGRCLGQAERRFFRSHHSYSFQVGHLIRRSRIACSACS